MKILEMLFGKKRNDSDTKDNTEDNIMLDTSKIFPFMSRVDVKNYENGAFIYNPGGNEKLLKKISDDLACIYLITNDKSQPTIVSKDFINNLNITPEKIDLYAQQNLVKLFNDKGQMLKKEVNNHSTLYTMILNQKSEATLLISDDIWKAIQEQLGVDAIFVSVPKQNEINYCSIKGNSLEDLFLKTIQSFNDGGTQKLSPNVYLLHNSKWIMFDDGLEQIFEYCVKNKLIEGIEGFM